jgi:hypothetical protein
MNSKMGWRVIRKLWSKMLCQCEALPAVAVGDIIYLWVELWQKCPSYSIIFQNALHFIGC